MWVGGGADLGRSPSFGEGNKMVDVVANVLDRYLFWGFTSISGITVFLIRVQFSSCNILRACSIVSATSRCRPPLDKPESAPVLRDIDVTQCSIMYKSKTSKNILIVV